jgi:hypothetical protein
MNNNIILLSFESPSFGSEGDESSFFNWLKNFTHAVGGDYKNIVIHVEANDDNLRELLAIFDRYDIPMRSLAIFESDGNRFWFKRVGTYWYERVFMDTGKGDGG